VYHAVVVKPGFHVLKSVGIVMVQYVRMRMRHYLIRRSEHWWSRWNIFFLDMWMPQSYILYNYCFLLLGLKIVHLMLIKKRKYKWMNKVDRLYICKSCSNVCIQTRNIEVCGYLTRCGNWWSLQQLRKREYSKYILNLTACISVPVSAMQKSHRSFSVENWT